MDLKPCPFCKSIEHVEVIQYKEVHPGNWFLANRWIVICRRCFLQVGFEDSKEEAIEWWNDRNKGDKNA